MHDHIAAFFDISPKKLRQGVVTGLLYAAITMILTLCNTFETLELKSLDLRFSQIPATPAKSVPDEVVIVAIDQGSLDAVLKTTSQRWPWPREFYGLIVDYLSSADAKAIAFDMWFSEPDIARQDVDAESSDATFIEATRRSGKVFQGYVLKQTGQQLPTPKQVKLLESLRDYEGAVDPAIVLRNHETAEFPLPQLAEASREVGFLNSAMPRDKDNVSRKISLLATYKNIPCLSLPAAVAWDVAGRPLITAKDGIFSLGDSSVPIDNNARAFLWWYKTPKAGTVFKTYSAHDVLRSAILVREGLQPMIPSTAFRDKIVLVGSTAQGLFDVKATPISPNVPGIEIQATALANLLRQEFVSRGHRLALFAVLALLCVAVGITARSARHVTTGLGLVILLMVGTWITGYFALARCHVFIEIIPLLTGLLLTFIATTLMNYFSEQQHAKLVRGIFEHYLDRSVVKTLIHDPTQVRLGGETRTCTVIFSDVANFTNMSEMLSPDQVVTFMNIYLNAMTDIIISEGGFVDKFVGDEIVAIFGAPNDLPDHATRACAAVSRMQKRIIELQPSFADVGCIREVFARTGISTGDMVVGNMGSEERMNYTAMGDAMNLGARIEGTNKIYGTRTIVSEPTASAAEDSFIFRELDVVQVKGKVSGARIYELVDGKNDITPAKMEVVDRFTRALAHYRAAKWQDALELFSQDAESGDEPSAVFAARCREFLVTPPVGAWDGVYVMTTK